MVDKPLDLGGFGFRLKELPDNKQVTGLDLKRTMGEHIDTKHVDKTTEEINVMIEEHYETQASMKWIIEFLFGRVVKNPVTGDRSFDQTGILADFTVARERGEKPQVVIKSARWEPSAHVKWVLGSTLLAFITLVSMLVWAAVVMITGQPINPPGLGL